MFLTCFLLIFHALHTESRENLQYYEGPTDKTNEAFQEWFENFQNIRDEIKSGLDLSIYTVPEVSWSRKSFIQPQVMVHDR